MAYSLTPSLADFKQPASDYNKFTGGKTWQQEFVAIDIGNAERNISQAIDTSALASLVFHLENTSVNPLTNLRIITGNSIDASGNIVEPTVASDLVGSNLIETNYLDLTVLSGGNAADAVIAIYPLPAKYIQFKAKGADAALVGVKLMARALLS